MSSPTNFRHLKVGDKVTRVLGGVVPMPLTVTKVTDSVIECQLWTFHPDTGGEIDEDLGWDGVRSTGSCLVHHDASVGMTDMPEE